MPSFSSLPTRGPPFLQAARMSVYVSLWTITTLTSKSHPLFQNLQVFWLPEFRYQCAASTLDLLADLWIEGSAPIIIQLATTQNCSILSPRKNMRIVGPKSMLGSESHSGNASRGSFHYQNLALCHPISKARDALRKECLNL